MVLISSPAWADVKIENAWARATPPGAKIGAGYMTIRNSSGTPDKLIGASSPAAATVSPHVTVEEGGISKMRPVKGYDIPANGSFELKPSGAHLMLMNLKAPLKAGERVPLVLRFQNSGDVKVDLDVRPLGATGDGQDMHDMHH
jgi:copper(I)-binding protein